MDARHFFPLCVGLLLHISSCVCLTLLTLFLYLQITFISTVPLLISFLSSHQISTSTTFILMTQPAPSIFFNLTFPVSGLSFLSCFLSF